MDLFKGITKIVLSPLRGVKEIGDDLSGKTDDNDETHGLQQAGSISTLGLSSMVKGTFKGIKSGIDNIFED